MSTKVIPKALQAKGQFNGGAILENKPIGFPREGGVGKPYSSLFYWAHAWSDEGSTIGEHPHQGFEIMSFVLKGDIEHYDSKYRRWLPLKAGDTQIIRAGNGISHAEKMNAGSHIFQIWLDPNLKNTLGQPASYDDYREEVFPVTTQPGMTTTWYAGGEGPMKIETPGVEIRKIVFEPGEYSLPAFTDKVYSLYVIEGQGAVSGQKINPDDFAIINEADTINFQAETSTVVFVITSPAKLEYSTYARMSGMWQ
ncbi:MAG: pirin family protein [Bacteroidia bacterium]|nr:pirin family protein [Bacteroidia bacterium]